MFLELPLLIFSENLRGDSVVWVVALKTSKGVGSAFSRVLYWLEIDNNRDE